MAANPTIAERKPHCARACKETRARGASGGVMARRTGWRWRAAGSISRSHSPGATVSGLPSDRRGDRSGAAADEAPRRRLRLALPVMQGKGKPLASAPGRRATPWTPVMGHRRAASRQARAGARYPAGAAAGVRPRGWRLGYGGGFYDRTLPSSRARKPSSPSASPTTSRRSTPCRIWDYDQRLDWVLTPSGPHRCQA